MQTKQNIFNEEEEKALFPLKYKMIYGHMAIDLLIVRV